MVTSVNTNINAMAAIQSLNAISSQMTSTQSAIESGLAINSAADSPAVFAIAQGLRGNIQALQAVGANLATGVATVQAQTQGATSISNALNTLLTTVTLAQKQSGAALAVSNATITNALSNIDAFANATTLNGVNMLSGVNNSFSVVSNISGATTSVTTVGASTSAGLGLTGLAVTVGGSTLAANATLSATSAITYTDSRGNATTFAFSQAPTVAAGVTTPPWSITTPAAGATVGSDGATYNQTQTITVVLGATNSVTMNALEAAMQANGITATIDGSGNISVAGTGPSTQNVATALAAGVTVAPSGGNSFTAASTDFTTGTTTNGGAAIDTVNAAITQINATLSALGAATQQLQGLSDFTSQLATSVQTGLGAMVDANLSQESAQLSSLQTKQSLAIQSLSLANQGPGALLQLFR
jgi:flagellin